MRKLIGLFAFLLLWSVQIGFTQTREISGMVVDKTDNSPLPGVSIVLKNNPSVGTATDNNGRFSIRVSSGDILIVSSIGMQTQEVAVGNRNNITIELVPTTSTLEEFIVVGYGTVRREAKTGAVASFSGDELVEIPAVSFDKMLSGRMAGVSVTASSGQPGASTNIRIRGTSSVNAGNEPLYVVDGIPIMQGNQAVFTNTGNAIASINPSDIESVTVLKDAAAASIYGSRAANGVVLITTKNGREGRNILTARAKFGVSWLANDNDFGMMNGEELLSYQRQAAINAGQDPDNPTSTYYRPYELLSRPQTNWMKHLTRLGKMQEYEVTAQGGNNKTRFYSSLAYLQSEGIYYGVNYKRMTGRVNVDHQLADRLTMGTRVNVAYMYSDDVPMQSLYNANPAFAGMIILPWTSPYDENGNHTSNIPENSDANPRATAIYDDQWDKQYRFLGSMYLDWKPIEGLTLRTTNAAELTFGEGRRYWAEETNQGETNLQTSNRLYRQLTTSNTATYENVFNEDHSFRVLAGQEAMQRYYHYYYISSPKVDPNIPYPSTSTADDDRADYTRNTRSLMSVFGVVDYSYASRYFLQASLRYDGSSLFGKNNQWGLFYSVGLSWNLHNESFIEGTENWLDIAKVRLSYGVNGNNDIAPYRQYGVYTAVEYNGTTGFRPSTPANDNLKWEKNESLNVGIDFGFLNRITGSFDFYTRKASDMLLNRPLSFTTGFSSSLQNVGSLRNKGIEFQLEGSVIEKGDWRWDLGFNIAHNKSKVLKLADGEMINWVNPDTGDSDNRLKHIEGESFLTFYLKDYYGVNPLNGEALYRDENGRLTNDYNAAPFIYAGSPEPTYTGGFFTTVSWKGLSLNALFEFKGGNKVMIIENRYIQSDGNQMAMNQAKNALNYWKNPGDTRVNPKPIAGNTSNSYNFATTRMLEKGDYLRIKDVTLSYTLPDYISKKAKLSSTKIYVSGLNLYTFHDVNFWDPERGIDGMGFGIYPMTKTFVGGIEISF